MSDREQLERFFAFLQEAILEASDEEVLTVVPERGEDPGAITARMRAVISKARQRAAL